MSLTTISDIHVKTVGDAGWQVLMKFLEHPASQEASHVGLLGDIFDLMCGPHEEYLVDFAPFFEKLSQLCAAGKTVWYFEGNHDLHLRGMFHKWFKSRPVTEASRFQLFDRPLVTYVDGKHLYLSHGDEHNPEDKLYLRYKTLITSFPAKILAEHLMPYSFLNWAGIKASKKSRAAGAKKFDEEKIRQAFRKGLLNLPKNEYDFILGGHSHVVECFSVEERGIYLNNGYVQKSGKIIQVDAHGGRLLEI